MKIPGKRAALYVGQEVTYGTAISIAAALACRHVSAQFNFDPKNRVFSPEKKTGPGRYARFDRRQTADVSVEGILRPSGTILTLPECHVFLKSWFGSHTAPSLSTTFTGTPTVSGGTLTSGAGLAVGDGLLITCPDAVKRVRILTAINTGTGVATWAPQLPAGQAPASGAAAKSCISYKLTSANALSYSVWRYLKSADFTAALGELSTGCLADRLSLMFDYQDEPRFSVSGPAQDKADVGSQPSFTQVGTNPPNGMTAEALIGNTAVKFMKSQVEGTNGMEARNDEINASAPTEGYRMGDRDITVAFDMLGEASLKTALYDLAMAGTNASLFQQVGFTEGKIAGLFAANVEWKPTTQDVGDGAVNWPFKGIALESVEDANDELVLVLA
jgi:hypothetical protein